MYADVWGQDGRSQLNQFNDFLFRQQTENKRKKFHKQPKAIRPHIYIYIGIEKRNEWNGIGRKRRPKASLCDRNLPLHLHPWLALQFGSECVCDCWIILIWYEHNSRRLGCRLPGSHIESAPHIYRDYNEFQLVDIGNGYKSCTSICTASCSVLLPSLLLDFGLWLYRWWLHVVTLCSSTCLWYTYYPLDYSNHHRWNSKFQPTMRLRFSQLHRVVFINCQSQTWSRSLK